MSNNKLNEMRGLIRSFIEEKMHEQLLDAVTSINTQLGYSVSPATNNNLGDLLISGYQHDPKINILVLDRTDAKLTYERGLSILREFETLYDTEDYRLLLVNPFGYTRECLSLMDDGALIKDESYFNDICNQAFGERDSVVNLLPHNERTYILLSEAIKSGVNACTVQATGTGKRFLAAKIINDYANSRVFYLSPSNHINNQQAELLRHLPKSKDSSLPTCETLTYQSLLNMAASDMRALNADLIIVDEFHRCGARKWGKKVRSLLKQNPNAILIGTTATPIRYTDGSKDMALSLFNGNSVTHLPLEVSIAKGITPCPKFVSGFFKSESVLNEELKKILSRTPKNQQEQAKREFAQQTGHLQSSQNIEEILSKHIDKIEGKYMVFCDSVSHLDDIYPTVKTWFLNIAKQRGIEGKVNIFHSHSKRPEKDNFEAISQFDACCSETDISVMLSINMYNEGLHLKGVSRVIQLRKTMSPTIFFQQIGRCLSVSGSETPIVFDLVDNANNIGLSIMRDSIRGCEEETNEERESKGLKKRKPKSAKLFDEVKPILSELEKISERLSNWFACYNAAIAYKEVFGHFRIDKAYVTHSDLKLGEWAAKVYKEHANGTLTKHQIDLLREINFPLTQTGAEASKVYAGHFSTIGNASRCLTREEADGVNALALYIAKHKSISNLHSDVMLKNNKEWRELYHWLKGCRAQLINGELNPLLNTRFKEFKLYLLKYTPSLSRQLKRKRS